MKKASEVAREIYGPVDEHLENEGAKTLGTCDYHFLADLIKADREAVREACAKKIRAECTACDGKGGEVVGGHYVTREMALDAGEPAMEGTPYEEEYQECEYCGRPMSAVRSLDLEGEL